MSCACWILLARAITALPGEKTATTWRFFALLKTSSTKARRISSWPGRTFPARPSVSFTIRRADSEFPTDTRIVDYRALEWADDGATVFLGNQEMEENGARGARRGQISRGGRLGTRSPTSRLWHVKDSHVIPEQKLREKQYREKNWLAAWHLDSARFVRLGDERIEDVWPVRHSRFAIGLDVNPYERLAMSGRGRRDVYVIDVTSGERRKITEALQGGPQFPDPLLNASPGGRYVIYLKDDDYWTYDLETGKHTNLTEDIETSFINREDDHPVEQKPPYGIAGWQEGDEAVVLHDKYDLWEVQPNGSGAKRLTDGFAATDSTSLREASTRTRNSSTARSPST